MKGFEGGSRFARAKDGALIFFDKDLQFFGGYVKLYISKINDFI